ncbi:MAG TPA: glycosyltransferase family 9 protein [Gemmatimonadales bacterium]|nr:glycosyltransferase family 9 protein [Gemmatimonadales bacterium]
MGSGFRVPASGSLIVRAPNHLGDLVMALPALEASGAEVIAVRRPLVPLLELAGLPGSILPLDRGATALIEAARTIRRQRFDRGVLLTPSLSSAILFRLAGVGRRRGSATDARSLLLTEAVPASAFAGLHRASSYMVLVTGSAPPAPPIPRLAPSPAGIARWREVSAGTDRPVGIFPGSNASSRRWAVERFAELAGRMVTRKIPVVIFGGPGELVLTAQVAAGGGLDLGGRTDLPALAAGLAACRLLVTNDSGPMHLAAAVGTPTLSLWGAGDPLETGPLGAGAALLRHAELPCVPCRANQCPRHGTGTLLPDAVRECLALITVDEVAARAMEN